jgi:flagellar basal-body rod modification protein FlgD
MTDIGVPQSARQRNNFGNIQIGSPFGRKRTALPESRGVDKSELLNKIAGARDVTSNDVEVVDGKKHNKLTKDDFLKLLSAQLQNQDPLNPMKQDKFSSELAQYSQLEQLTNINNNMKGMNKNMPVENKFFAASFLGKEILTNGSSLQLREGADSANVTFQLPEKAKNVMVRIFDNKNQMVQQVELEGLARGSQVFSWDGKDNQGLAAAPGEYRVQVQAWNDKVEQMKVQTKAAGTVTGVNFDNGEVMLLVDGNKKVLLRDVDSFNMPGFRDKTKLHSVKQDKQVGVAAGLGQMHKAKGTQPQTMKPQGLTSVYDE